MSPAGFVYAGSVLLRHCACVNMAVDVRLACEELRKLAFESEEPQELKTPGSLITATPGFMR